MGVLFAVGRALYLPALVFATSGSSRLVFTSASEPVLQRSVFGLVLALAPFLGWVLAVVRGMRKGVRTGAAGWALMTAPIVLATGAAIAIRLLAWRAVLHDLLASPIPPLMSASSIDAWRWGLGGALASAAILAAILLRTPRRPG
jgi:hypothetical protein